MTDREALRMAERHMFKVLRPSLPARDWTVGPEGRSNTSPAFELLVMEVVQALSHHCLGGDLGMTARGIVAMLAHRHGFAPAKRKRAADD